MPTKVNTVYIAEEHIWVTADRSRAVHFSDPEANTLHTPAGREMPLEEAERLGLIKPPKQQPVAETKTETTKPKPTTENPTIVSGQKPKPKPRVKAKGRAKAKATKEVKPEGDK